MGKKSDSFLLSDGDRLRLSSRTTLIFQAARQMDHQHFDLHQERDMQVGTLLKIVIRLTDDLPRLSLTNMS